ncbi:MAG: alpha/beta hydrolase-fold protein [Bacteroidota bacterium]
MKKTLQYFILPFCVFLSVQTFSQSLDTTIYIQSDILGETRSVTIGLPSGYYNSNKTYGSLYVLDAENKYNICRAAHQFFEISTRIPGSIMVAIANSSKENRNRDLLPPNFGGSDSLFRAFVEKEVMPYIEKNYRVNEDRTLSGHSHGGVFTVMTLLKRPDLFERYIAIDGSFQIINSNLPDSLTMDFTGKSLYICSSDGLYGYGEDISFDMKTNNMIFQNYLKRARNSNTGLRFYAEHIQDDHSHVLITGFQRGYRWVMDWPISEGTLRKQ